MDQSGIPPVERDIVFICGALRSGTTLLRLMVDGHPDVDNPGEMDFLFEPPLARDGSPDMNAYRVELSLNRVFVSRQMKFRDSLGYADQVRDFIGQLRRPGKRLTINVHRHFDRIPEIFPDARYVHLVRDPRDAAKSAIAMGWAGNVFHGVDHWINSEKDFERLAAKTPADRIFRLKNEDLIRDPRRWLTRLCDFLGVSYDDEMLNYPVRSTYGPPDIRLIEQWRRDLTPREVELIEIKARGLMVERGYEPSTEASRPPKGLELAAIRLGNSWGRFRFAANRHGLAITLLEMIAVRAPAPALKYFVRRRKFERARLHVK